MPLDALSPAGWCQVGSVAVRDDRIQDSLWRFAIAQGQHIFRALTGSFLFLLKRMAPTTGDNRDT
jgi:hypothetical protein